MNIELVGMPTWSEAASRCKGATTPIEQSRGPSHEGEKRLDRLQRRRGGGSDDIGDVQLESATVLSALSLQHSPRSAGHKTAANASLWPRRSRNKARVAGAKVQGRYGHRPVSKPELITQPGRTSGKCKTKGHKDAALDPAERSTADRMESREDRALPAGPNAQVHLRRVALRGRISKQLGNSVF